jgi:DNA repair exonuclease SbcCD nuclease subunit
MKFIHTSDWQIGMPFLFLPEKSRNLMEQARLDAITNIAKLAKDPSRGIDFVLICGDIVDTPRISDSVVRQLMREVKGIEKPVYFLAGNHEWKGSEYIFENEHFREMLPSNAEILKVGVNPTMFDNVKIVAAPLEGKHASDDVLRSVLSNLEKSNEIRIVAAHGSLNTFIAVNSDDKKLDFSAIFDSLNSQLVNYVALGDRHSTTSVDKNGKLIPFVPEPNIEVLPIYYSGAHEATDYDELDSGNVLIVEIKDSGDTRVEKVRVGNWRLVEGSTLQHPTLLRSAEDLEELKTFIESLGNPRQTAVKIYLDSELTLDEDMRRIELFRQWSEELLAGFDVSDNEKMPVPKIKVDPMDFEIPDNLKGYVRESYQELRELALGNGPDSKAAYEAFSLLVSLLGNRQ